MNADQWITLIGVIGASVTPIMVAVIGIRMEFSRKKAREYDEMKEQQKADQAQSISSSFDTLTKSVSELESAVSEIRTTLDDQERNISLIARSSQINGQYTHNLAQMVMVLAEGVRDQHLDGNITRAIETFHNFESEMLNKILTKYPDTTKESEDKS